MTVHAIGLMLLISTQLCRSDLGGRGERSLKEGMCLVLRGEMSLVAVVMFLSPQSGSEDGRRNDPPLPLTTTKNTS